MVSLTFHLSEQPPVPTSLDKLCPTLCGYKVMTIACIGYLRMDDLGMLEDADDISHHLDTHVIENILHSGRNTSVFQA